jgi:hypothetical protein
MALTKVPSNLDATVSTTQAASDNSTNVATTAYVTTALANLVDSSPSSLNTLNELAAALGDDANYATTTTNAIAAKAPLASPAFTGTPVIGTSTAGALEVGSADSFQIQKSGVNAYINQSDSGPIIFRMGSGFAEKMRLDASGKLGISTTASLSGSDYGMLTIKKTGSNIFGDSAITINSADTNQSTLALGLTSSLAYVDSTESGSGTVLPLVFATGSTEKMRIRSDGGVAIGTNNAGYSGQILSVKAGSNDNVFYGESTDAKCIMSVRDGDSTTNVGFGATGNAHVFSQDGTEIARFSSGSADKYPTSGNGGIGGAGSNLHLAGDDSEIRMANQIIHSDNSGLTKFTLRNAYGYHSTGAELSLDSGYISFNTGSSYTERVRIDAAGNMIFGSSDAAQNTTAGVKIKNDPASGPNGRVFTVSTNSSGETFSAYQLNYGYTFYVTNNGKIHTAVGPAVYAVSDERLKENIRDLDKGLTDILKLKPRTFDWKENEGSGKKNVSGFIAQECEEAGFEEFVGDFKHDTLTDAKSFGHGGLVPALVKAIQELEARITDLEG